MCFPTFFFHMSKGTKVFAPSAGTSIHFHVSGNARLQNIGGFFKSLYHNSDKNILIDFLALYDLSTIFE